MAILVVESNGIIQRRICSALERADLGEITTCNNAETAFQLLQHRPVDIVIIGSDLGSMNAVAFAAKLRRKDNYTKIPLLLVTEHSTHEDVLHAIESGIDQYILIPFDPESFIVKVQQALQRAASQLQASQRPPQRNVEVYRKLLN